MSNIENSFESEMISPERKEEIAKQNLSKINEISSQAQQRSSIYDKDQGNIPMPSKKPPNEFEVQQILKGETINNSKVPNKRKINFTNNDGNTIEIDDQGSINNFGIPKPGYYFIPDKLLPSEGNFYPHGYSIAFRSATTKEMRHYGTTDTGDYNEFAAALDYMIRNCCEIKINTIGTSNHLDLLEFDRIYLLFCIRELTLPEGTPPFTMEHDCRCGYVNNVIISKDTINKMDWNVPIYDDEPEKTLARYYNTEKRCFNISFTNRNDKTNEEFPDNITLYVPTIGVVQKMLKFIKKEMMKKKNLDIDNLDVFKEYAKLYYLIPNHKSLNEDSKGNIFYIKDIMNKMNTWTLLKTQLFIILTDMIENACKPSVSYICKSCGEEVSADIMFHEGYKSVFIDKSNNLRPVLS